MLICSSILRRRQPHRRSFFSSFRFLLLIFLNYVNILDCLIEFQTSMKSPALLALICAIALPSCQNLSLPWKKDTTDPYATNTDPYQTYPAAGGYGQQSYPQQGGYAPAGEQAQVYPAGGGQAQGGYDANAGYTDQTGYADPAPAAVSSGGGGRSYTVKKGDTLSRISRSQGASVNQIMRANGLSSDLIRVGQTLRIP
jgi:LysM repeat protein